MVQAADVIDAFLEGQSVELFGEDFILKNKVLYGYSLGWPLAIWGDIGLGPTIFVNVSRRGSVSADISNRLVSYLSMKSMEYSTVTFDFMKEREELAKRESNSAASVFVQLDEVKAQLQTEKAEHDETKLQRNEERRKRVDAETELDAEKKKNKDAKAAKDPA